MTKITINQIATQFSRPVRHGNGYVIDEQRGDLAFRSHILPSYRAAMEYRAEAIRRKAKQDQASLPRL